MIIVIIISRGIGIEMSHRLLIKYQMIFSYMSENNVGGLYY